MPAFFRFAILYLALLAAPPAHAGSDLQALIADHDFLNNQSVAVKSELDRFYALRAYQPVWTMSDEDGSGKISAFIDSMQALAEVHGLDPAPYSFDDLRQWAASKNDSDKQKLELLLTTSSLRLAHDLHGDTIDLATLYTGWVFRRDAIDVPALMAAAISNGSLGHFFEDLAPQNKAYADLTAALALYRHLAKSGAWPVIASGSVLRPMDRDPRVAQLRARLAAEQYLDTKPEDQDLFDTDLAQAFIAYQARNGLSPDGHLGGKTLQALNIPLTARIEQIRANMERRRHMRDDFPSDHYVLVNIPDYSVTIRDHGDLLYRGPVIDGTPDRPTPFIASAINSVVINPSWHVPLSIARKDIVPKLRQDPHYLEKQNIIIAGRGNDPAGVTIDWQHLKDSGFHLQLRQNPGDMNSLGQLKFDFANPFSVYLHGTPHQELFSKAERDLSSGCVRLADPVRVGAILLAANKDQGGWNEDRIRAAIDAGETKWIKLMRPMPVYFLYWTVFSDDNGRINFRNDIYNYDRFMP